VFVGGTTKEAIREARNGVLARDWNDYFYPLLKRDDMLKMCKVDPAIPDREVTVDYMIQNVWIVGDADAVAEKITRLHRDVGGFGVLLAMAHEWSPRAAWERSFRLLAEAVRPQLP
jgi:alkanesulfonate monooxygenase SsuD/methylene tetrahydromethanopterin reductase-like flavin-dependent oxidoreductase (luciferase family)